MKSRPRSVSRHTSSRWSPAQKEVRDGVVAAVTGNAEIASFDAGAECCPDVVKGDSDRLYPEDDHLHREVGSRSVGQEPMLLDEVAGELAKAVAVGIAVESRAQRRSKPGIGLCRGVGGPVFHAQIHHVAEMQAEQVEVGKLSRRSEDRQHAAWQPASADRSSAAGRSGSRSGARPDCSRPSRIRRRPVRGWDVPASRCRTGAGTPGRSRRLSCFPIFMTCRWILRR